MYHTEMVVTWSHLDANRHMRNTAYSEFATHARINFFRQSGQEIDQLAHIGIGPILLKEELIYLREVKMHEKLSIAIELRNQGWALMSSFPNLSDSELDGIYYFVEKRYKMSLDGIPVPIDFEFKMSENKRAKACAHIITEKRDILNVSVSKNRFWEFSCGIENHKQSEFKRTTLKDMFDFDNSINDLTFMTYEFPAKRISKESEWE